MEKGMSMRRAISCTVVMFGILMGSVQVRGAVRGEPAAEAQAQPDTGGIEYKEIEPIGVAPEQQFAKLATFCLDRKGNLLACDVELRQVRKLSSRGEILARWQLDFASWATMRPQTGQSM